jgi:hypothetical protein
MYFEIPGADIKEPKARLRDWHEKKLKLVVVTSVVFHVYRRSESDIEEDGHKVDLAGACGLEAAPDDAALKL